MQPTKMSWVRDCANDLGQRPSAYRDRPVTRIGPKSNWAVTVSLPNLLAVGNLDRGWLLAFVWTPGTRAGSSKMMSRLGMVLYQCGVAIALMCGIAVLTILAAIATNKSSDLGTWTAVVFFTVVGVFFWMASRVAKHFLAGS